MQFTKFTLKVVSLIAGVYLRLNGTRYANDSEILMFEIGREDSQALQCVTSKRPCCKTSRTGQWYFPSGIEVSVEDSAQFFYRNRGDDGTVNLNRVSENVVSPTGQFCCVVPDSNDTIQTLCANVVLELTSSKPQNNA